MKRGKMTAVIGGQYGSEGKGSIVAHIANEYDVHVRVGSPNAGHTIYWNGEKHVMQSIPCGWINPHAVVVIGRGALINMDLLMSEIKHIEEYYPNFRSRLMIDENAGILSESFHKEEGGINGEMHRRIGSTGEGVGIARITRIQRNTDNFKLFKDVVDMYNLRESMYEETNKYISEMQDRGKNILLEGTQGSMLSLLHGFYPYVTSIDTNSAQLLAEIGLAPQRLTDVILVCRTYPIRVAGNSGYMKNEITWEELSNRIGKPVTEKTTVTKKIRRIAEWDSEIFEKACILNNPTCIALNFADYIDPSIEGSTSVVDILNSDKLYAFVHEIKRISGVDVKYIGTGGIPTKVVEI